MWFKSESMGKFVYVVYKAVRDDQGEFQGVLEYVQDIQPFLRLTAIFIGISKSYRTAHKSGPLCYNENMISGIINVKRGRYDLA